MSTENEQEQLDQAGDEGTGTGAGGDLSDVLASNQDTTFVTEEKKSLSTGTFIMAGFLLACGAATYFMYNRSTSANAAPTADAAAAQTTINKFLTDDKANVNKMKDLLANTEKAVEQFRSSPGKVQVPVDDLNTNPFRFAELDAKTSNEEVDAITAKKREEAARAAALKTAQTLNLQFVMSGKNKSCMINDAVYHEGDVISEFTVESISTDSVIISKDTQKFRLKIKR